MNVVQNELLELTPNELATLSVCLEVPQPMGLGVHPLDELSAAGRTLTMRSCLESLADKGCVDALPGERFRVRDHVAQIVSVAARPSAVLRLVATDAGQTTGLVFVYGIRDLAVVHEVCLDGRQRLMPKSLVDAVAELADVLGGLPPGADRADDSVVLTRAQLVPGPDQSGTVVDPQVALIRGDLTRAAKSVRLDLAWRNGAAIVAPYLTVFTADSETSWILTGVGAEQDDLVTCRRADLTQVRRALGAMLVGSAFVPAG
ncbi:MAG: hypothetical protein ABI903_00690 [Actinomycetota bacterium]